MHVCVLGAGIVGLATAWELQRIGHEITIVDKARPGDGASGGNGAQLSYSYVQPLADPALWAQLPKLLFSRESPLKLRPRLDPLQWRWVADFLRACNAATSRESTEALLALAAESRAAFDAMLARTNIDCDYSQTGKLVLYANDEGVAAARRQIELQQRLGGAAQRIVGPDECVAIEPALSGYRGRIAGAVFTPSEAAADCLALCQGLAKVLQARGARFVLGAEATGFRESAGRLVAVRTSVGDIEARCFVMALGSASHRLGRRLDVSLPVYPLKGYSITLDVRPQPAAAPRVNVTDSARKVVFARIGQRLRVAGMAELVGHDGRIPAGRIDSLVDATRALFPEASDFGELHPWTGMRPATPTGLPIIGRRAPAPDNLLFNTGHGALGFTLAFGSARRIAALFRTG